MGLLKLILQLLQSILEGFLTKSQGKPVISELPPVEPSQPVLDTSGLNITWKASPNYSIKANREISLLVLHHTGTMNDKGDLDWLCDPQSKVSAHYMIMLDGSIYQLVDDKAVAWHAGVSEWKGRPYCNNYSIGIEVCGDTTKMPFNDKQYASIVSLFKFLKNKYNISIDNICSHKQVSPGRKVDVDEKNFDWTKFYSDIDVK